MLKYYSKFLDVLELIAKAFLAVTGIAMVLVLFYQVVMRYCFHSAAAFSHHERVEPILVAAI